MNWIGEGLLVLCISTMVPNGIACQMTIGVRGGLARGSSMGGDVRSSAQTRPAHSGLPLRSMARGRPAER